MLSNHDNMDPKNQKIDKEKENERAGCRFKYTGKRRLTGRDKRYPGGAGGHDGEKRIKTSQDKTKSSKSGRACLLRCLYYSVLMMREQLHLKMKIPNPYILSQSLNELYGLWVNKTPSQKK